YLISVLGVDPAARAARVTLPMLIVQGTRDLQVSVADAQMLKAAAPRATLALLPDVNHVLKHVDGDARGANLATYADPNLPLAPGVVDTVAKFVSAPDRR
ncbi:hypothetical protein, partial [Campylobacter coli]